MKYRKYFALKANGNLQYVGMFLNWYDANECEGEDVIWLFDEDTAKEWVNQLNRHIFSSDL